MKVNLNISAVISNNQLLRTESNLSASIERLSSGLRINNAKDDPAGLAISNKMKQQIDGLEQAARNAQDGTSVLNTADGALNEITSILQRIRELSVQAANGTNTQADKQAAQDEVASLTEEVDRISSDTEFNTKTLLDGTLDTRVYAKYVSRISVSDYVPTGDYSVMVKEAGTQATFSTTTLATDLQGKDASLTINGYSVSINASDDADAVFEKIRDAAQYGEADVEKNGTTGALEFTSNAYGSKGELDISYEYNDASGTKVTTNVTGTTKYGKDAVVLTKPETGADNYNFADTATVTTDGNRVTITDKDGFSLGFLIDSDVVDGKRLDFEVTDIGTMNVQVGANENQMINIRIPEISSKSLYLDQVDVTTVNGAAEAMNTLDDAIAVTSAVRSKIGAYSNRLEYASSSLGQTDEDLTAAFSRIKDIDMATEMTSYANLQVLQQAGTSVLSQANDIPQQVLQLLQ